MSDVLVAEEVFRCEEHDKTFKNRNGLNGHNRIKHPEGVGPPEDDDPVREPVPVGKAPLKPYPFHDGAVNENAAIRMVRMVIPICTADSNPEILRKDGTSVPNPRYTGEPNCQQVYKLNNHGRWDVAKCISLGHDPYYTVFRKTIVEDVVGEDGYVTSTKTRVKSERRLNVVPISVNKRHSTGDELMRAIARGCKTLEEFGYASPCEFRACSKPQVVNTRYGRFCSERHARLVAADARSIMLPIGGDLYTQDQAFEERESILENLNIGRAG